MYGHSFLCTLYTIIYVRFLYPICTSYVGYMKSKIFQKSQKNAKIGQKSQNWPRRPKFSKKAKKCQKMPNLPKCQNYPKLGFFGQFLLFWPIFAFLANFCFFGQFWLFWPILAFLDFFWLFRKI
jgi:hypothetical protein